MRLRTIPVLQAMLVAGLSMLLPAVALGAPAVTYPSATGIRWERGSAHTITWSGFPGASVKIELYKGSSRFLTIRSSEANDGSLSWTVPSTLALGADYKIKITSVSSTSNNDMSNSAFAVIVPAPRVTWPSATGGTWKRGERKTITWRGFAGATVKIELYKGAVRSRMINSAAANNGSYPWTMPTSQAVGYDYKIRVSSAATPTQLDLSDNFFSIPTPGNPAQLTVTLPGNVPLTLMRVPSGAFVMGSADSERNRSADEGSTHSISFGYTYYMGKYEITQKQWKALMGTNPATDLGFAPVGVGDNYPVYNVSWNDCQAFVTALNKHILKTGQCEASFRLPSEAEWERGCRAGTRTRFFYGDSLLSVNDGFGGDGPTNGPAGTSTGTRSDYMWFYFNCQGNANGAYGSKPVGTKRPNQYGLYDMSGNVWEWCQDYSHDNYAGAPLDGSAWLSPTSSQRVLRGGCWIVNADICRSANRSRSKPDGREGNLGVRLVQTRPANIVVSVAPKTARWTLVGPPGFEGNSRTYTGDQSFMYAPAGQYNWAGLDLTSYTKPASQQTTLLADGRISFNKVWTGSGGQEITVSLPGNVPLTLVLLPAGSFQMGSPSTERGHEPNEGPVHAVNIGYSFYMGRYEITQRQWQAVMGNNPAYGYGVGDNYPEYYVSWNDCQRFATTLNDHIASTKQGPATFRLPSEAEWEYACRAGTQTRFFFGDSLGADDGSTDAPTGGPLPGNRSDYMWFGFNANTPTYGSKPVGTKLPNQFGLYDMRGNVWEWCQDYWHNDYTGAPNDGSAWGASSSGGRVPRSGDWSIAARFCRSADRHVISPTNREFGVGVRVVRTQ